MDTFVLSLLTFIAGLLIGAGYKEGQMENEYEEK